MSFRKRFFAGVVTMLCGVAFGASGTVTLDRAQQRYPYNGLVDIDYTIAELDHDADDYYIELSASGTNTEGQVFSFVLSNFVAEACCDLPNRVGSHRVTWDSKADGRHFLAPQTTFAAKLVYCPVTRLDADYVIVDVTGYGTSRTIPVRYVRAPGLPTAQFNTSLYKRDKIVLKRVKAGTFRMSQTASSEGYPVRLTKDFFLGVFPVTHAQWNHVTSTGPVDDGSADNPKGEQPADNKWWSYFQTDGSGSSAGRGFRSKLEYCARCRSQAVTGFGLPTAAQGEYACRAGTTTTYYWGESAGTADVNPYLWYKDNSGSTEHAVGRKLPNAWGFYDMLGNCNEYFSDYWDNTNYKTCSIIYDPAYNPDGETVDPVGFSGGISTSTRVRRNGNYGSTIGNCTSSSRVGNDSSAQPGYGFRLLLAVQ